MGNVTNTFYASEGFNGYGSQLLVGNTESPSSYEAIAFIDSITPGNMETAVIDRTHLRSPAAHREKLAGLRDSGPFTVKGTWVPGHESQSNAGGGAGAFATGGLVFLWRTRAVRGFKIVCSDDDATEWPFVGFVSKFQPGEITGDGKVDFTAEITPNQDFSADLP